jgi:transposase
VEKIAKRRMRSKVERRQIVEETFKDGASVAQIARSHGVNANQVFNWRKLYHAGQLESDSTTNKLLPVKIADVPPVVAAAVAKRGQKAASGVIDIDLGYARVRIEGAANPACVRAVMEGLRR